jgi:hypothetical protein
MFFFNLASFIFRLSTEIALLSTLSHVKIGFICSEYKILLVGRRNRAFEESFL